MSASDALRYAVIAVCIFNIGTLLALWERAARLLPPYTSMRLLMAANVVLLAVAALGAYARLGEPLTYRSPVWFVAAALEAVALVGIHRWYGTPAGRAYTERMRGNGKG